MIYLASPYSHRDPAMRQMRFNDACRAAAHLIRQGYAVFSPIAHGHSICRYGLPTDWRFWEPIVRQHLECSEEVVVLMLDGWRESVGVHAEIRIAGECGRPVRYLAQDAVDSPWLAHVAKEAGR